MFSVKHNILLLILLAFFGPICQNSISSAIRNFCTFHLVIIAAGEVCGIFSLA